MSAEHIKDVVKEKYGDPVIRARAGAGYGNPAALAESACCAPGCCH